MGACVLRGKAETVSEGSLMNWQVIASGQDQLERLKKQKERL